MRQTILGSTGVVGTELAKELPKYTDKIRVVSRNPQPILGSEELVKANLLDQAQTNKAVEGSDIVYLTVGLKYTTKTWQREWPVIMKNVINACEKHHAKLLFFDNVYMYGKVEGVMTEETAYNPCSKKGEVRKEISLLLEHAIKEKRIEAIIARSADFFGRNAHLTFTMPMIFDKYKAYKTASWLLDKTQKHSLTYVSDAVKGLAILGNTSDAYNQVWHLPTDKEALTGEEFMNKVAHAYGVKPKQSVVPLWMLSLLGVFIPSMAETKEMGYQFTHPYLFDSSKFERTFFKATPYQKAIEETV